MLELEVSFPSDPGVCVEKTCEDRFTEFVIVNDEGGKVALCALHADVLRLILRARQEDWPAGWLDRVRLYRQRVSDEWHRLEVFGPPPAALHDTTRLGADIGRLGRLLALLPIGQVKRSYRA